MASRSLLFWQNDSADALDEIEAAHARVGGTARGRRYATQQINQAYVVLLASRFQKFCRDLHSETAAELVRCVPLSLQPIIQREWTTGRKLDSGNPNPGNVGADFGRLGMRFWDEVDALSATNKARRGKLDLMFEWRNAIGHQDFMNKQGLKGRTEIQLQEVRGFRGNCSVLTTYFDKVALAHIHAVAGPTAGW